MKRQVAIAEISADFDARIHAAQASHEHLKRQFEMLQKAQESFTEQQLDKAETEMVIAKWGLKELRRQEVLAKRNLDYYKASLQEYLIISPIDGVVANLWIETGEMVDMAQKVLEIVDPDTVEVRVHIHENNLKQFALARTTMVRFPAVESKRSFPGTIHYVSPYVDSSSGTFLVKILVDASEAAIRPGLGCDVRFLRTPLAGKMASSHSR